MAESKVPGFSAGEYLRDATDPRLLAILPRVENEPDQTYLARLQHSGLAVVISREELKTGGFPRALAKAISLGTPVLMPYEEGESRPEPVTESKPFDMIQFRREALAREQADAALHSPINPR